MSHSHVYRTSTVYLLTSRKAFIHSLQGINAVLLLAHDPNLSIFHTSHAFYITRRISVCTQWMSLLYLAHIFFYMYTHNAIDSLFMYQEFLLWSLVGGLTVIIIGAFDDE